MTVKKLKLRRFLQVFAGIAILLTLLPLLPLDYWWVRMFDFPHIQLTTLTLIAILTYYITFDINRRHDYIFMIALITCFIYQFTKIYPYTPLAKFEVMDSTISAKNRTLSLYTANVLQKNEERKKLVSQITEIDADILVITEADTKWQAAILKELPKTYRYKKEAPLDNTYGMLLYSKYELIDPQIRYIVNDSIPSIHTKVRLASNDIIQLYAIHPTPPMPQENPLSTDRDAEMMKIAILSKDSKIPVVVIGDLNDVAWSDTNNLLKRVGGLLDVRVGRGFYSTFNAKNPIMRWPLDHVFVSEEFRLNKIMSCETIESDHFPYHVKLTFEPEIAEEQKPEPPTNDELEDAMDQLENEIEEDAEDANER